MGGRGGGLGSVGGGGGGRGVRVDGLKNVGLNNGIITFFLWGRFIS